MGLRIDQLSPAIFARMAPADQAAYATNKASSCTPPERQPLDSLEREEQRVFANHCLKEGYGFAWHSTAHPSKASIGCPDFIVQVGGATLWIEFKRPGCYLSAEQEDFKERLCRHGARYYVVYSAAEAIVLTQSKHD